MRMLIVCIIAMLLCAYACSAGELAVYMSPKVCKPPVIDGKLDDDAWKVAPAVTLVLAETGKPATKDTKARMCWDDKYLYVAFDCVDQDVWGTLTEHDDYVFTEEVVEMFLSPNCDLARYYEINVSPRNTIFDAFIHNPGSGLPGTETSHAWTCEGLRTAIKVDGTLDDRTDIDRGWSAEIAIPFAALGRGTPRPGERWRGNLYRIDLSPEPEEFQAWSPTMNVPASFHIPTRFGTIFFSDGS